MPTIREPTPKMWPGVVNDDTAVWAHWMYFYGPILVSVITASLSLFVDLHFEAGQHWAARSGAIIALCGGISAFGGAKQTWIPFGKTGVKGVRSEIPYGKLGLWLGIVGTLVWAYLDRLI